MKLKLTVILSLCLLLNNNSIARSDKTIAINEGGTITAYVTVPSDFTCPVRVENLPTAFCKNNQDVIYHLSSSANIPYAISPEQYVNNLLQQWSGDSGIKVISYYPAPQITQYLIQRDSQLIYRSRQQMATYTIEFEDYSRNERSISVLAFHVIPLRGAVMSTYDIFGLSTPMTNSKSFNQLRQQLNEFIYSYKYDTQWVQSANAQTVQSNRNLTARENAFYNRQQQIHENNMNALDSSQSSFERRSRLSDKSQQNWVDSTHERQQLVDPNTGARYEAEGYYNYNYVNPNNPNDSIRTDNPMDNPNINTEQGRDYQQLEEYRR